MEIKPISLDTDELSGSNIMWLERLCWSCWMMFGVEDSICRAFFLCLPAQTYAVHVWTQSMVNIFMKLSWNDSSELIYTDANVLYICHLSITKEELSQLALLSLMLTLKDDTYIDSLSCHSRFYHVLFCTRICETLASVRVLFSRSNYIIWKCRSLCY